MLTYNMDNRQELPLYDYLYRCIKNDILSGRISVGEKLPSKRSLAKHLNISVITVENAYAQLLLEGYITSCEKKGYFVNDTGCVPQASCLIRPKAEEEFEYAYFADLKSNRIRRNRFPFSTWAKLLRDTLSERPEQLLKTVPYNGVYELRLALAEFLHEFRGMQVLPSQIVICSGTDSMYGRLFCLLDDAAWAVENIGSQKITGLYDMYHAKWKSVPRDEYGVDMNSLYESGCNVVHVSPAQHFPIGTVMPVKRRTELLEWADRKGYYIIEDDYDSEFWYQGKPAPTLYSLDGNGRVIYFNTFSKTLIPSLRISYMVLPYELAQRYEEGLSFYSGTVPSMEQYALARFISEGYFERHINHMRNYFKSQRGSLFEAVKESPLGGISHIYENSSGTYFLLELDTKLADKELVTRIREKDINVACTSEYMAQPHGDSHTLVINYCGVYAERIKETIQRIWEAIS
ncbi:transcriptional regulator with HTH domain and aminotransferase domain [Firmicutes bacterium CAG:882]|nr:transcriptional regulator with HTH domain and aminotransferase domain [Firmicutes bacterium CAG:882]